MLPAFLPKYVEPTSPHPHLAGSSPDLSPTQQEVGLLPQGTEPDLAQSLATLKIALTQQHVAAANGSVSGHAPVAQVTSSVQRVDCVRGVL